MTAIEATSKFQAIARVLRERITAGSYPPDSQLPTEHVLAGEFATSRVTVNRALRTLADEGLVEVHRGTGVFVIEPMRVTAGLLLETVVMNMAAAGAHLLLRFPDGSTRRIVLS